MKRLILAFCVGSALLSCNDEVERKTLDIERFSIDVPATWTLVEMQGYDSFVAQIRTSDQEAINIDLGWYSSNIHVDPATHDVTFQTIDNKNAKIVKPKKIQEGTTGVYFDSLDVQKTKLQMSGVDLSPENQHLLLAAFETIKFQ